MVSEFGFLSIETIKMQKQDYIQDPRYAEMKASTKVWDAKKAKARKKDRNEESDPPIP